MSPARSSFIFVTALLWLTGSTAVVVADGTVDGTIGAAYGSTRSMDRDDDGACSGTASRGDIIDFHAYNDSSNRWNFAFVVDSSHDLDNTTGSFFGQSASSTVTYLIPIDIGADGSPTINLTTSGTWQRNVTFPADYFVAMFPTGPNTLNAALYDSSRSLVTTVSVDVTSVVVDFRRHIELRLNGTTPTALFDGSAIKTMVFSTYNADGGNLVDAAGNGVTLSCPTSTTNFATNDLVTTAANCGGRQCTGLPTRTTVNALTGTTCSGEQGVDIDGNVSGSNEGYTFLSEAGFAGPYQGGSSTTSDFTGESANTVYYTGSSYSSRTQNTMGSGLTADLQYVNARAGTCFFYIEVEGPSAVNSGSSDLANLFIAIDRDGGSATNLPAPASRTVDFTGWQPDYVIELVWQGDTSSAGNLYTRSGTTWSTTASFTRTASPVNTGTLYNASHCPTLGTGDILYHNDTSVRGFEFAIPWNVLGGKPSTTTQLRLGVYTTYNDSGYDVYDQAPGIGQGCSGLACHERIGDEPHDVDSGTTGGDLTPYSGRTHGDGGDVPASDPFSDTDTIEEFFIFTAGDNVGCPTAVALTSISAGADGGPDWPLLAVTAALVGGAAYAVRRHRRRGEASLREAPR